MKIDFNKNEDPFIIKEKKYRFGNLKDSFYHLGWMEDSFLFGENDKEILRKSFDFGKIRSIFIVLLVVFSLLVLRLFWLQIIKGDEYRVLAEGNRIRVVNVEPKRGIIYSSNLSPLVKNEANFVLYLTPIDLPKDDLLRDQIIRKLALIISGIEENKNISLNDADYNLELIGDSPYFFDIKSKLDKIVYGTLESYRPLFLMDNIDYDSAMSLYLEAEKMPGVSLSTKMRRNYLGFNDNLLSLSHLLGYTGKISEKELEVFGEEYTLIDYIGKSGLESFYENELKGVKGKKYVEVDALGREKKIVSQIPPEDGHSLVLSIDIDLQRKAEEILKDYLSRNKMDRASIVALNPNNGEVLALVSWPSYDNNLFSKGIKQDDYSSLLNDSNRPLFNRAVSGNFPAGSTLKPTIAAAALEEKIINENTTVNSYGGISVGSWFFPDWKAGGHGLTNVKKAIAESVNTFFYFIGGGYNDFEGLGIDKIVEYLSLFGLGKQSGLDLSQEGSGFIPTPEWKKENRGEIWYIGNTYHVSIGQGDVLVTPLQVANFTSFFANNGRLYRPHLVKEVLAKDDKVFRKIEPEIIKENFISSENIKIIREGMRQTIVSGSARRLIALPVEIAGKTGTAQWQSDKYPHSWFTSFAPYNNPEIVLTVLVEEGIEGSQIATSIAGDILRWYFGGDEVEPESEAELGLGTENEAEIVD
ncbi:MAG: penicillin-binding protein 2 [Patescibacteria group bacterium]|nr:penicillin-binding protein 2 [Patescibacteria group bacterium]